MSEDRTNQRARRSDVEAAGEEEILGLIQKSPDDTKPMLMVLFQMNRSLTRNTEVTLQMSERIDTYEHVFDRHNKEFNTHVEQDARLFNRISGAWWAVSITAGIITLLGGYIFMAHMSDFNKQNEVVHQLELKVENFIGQTTRNSQLIDLKVIPAK